MAQAKRPMIVLGSVALQRSDSATLHSLATRLAHKLRESNDLNKGWKVFNVLHRVIIYAKHKTVKKY